MNTPDILEQDLTLPDGGTVIWPVSQAMIVMQRDRGTSFKGYQDINEFVKKIYTDLREDTAKEIFGRSWTDLSEAEMDVISQTVPMRVREMKHKDSPKSRVVGWMK